jgi:hypothetical protein
MTIGKRVGPVAIRNQTSNRGNVFSALNVGKDWVPAANIV